MIYFVTSANTALRKVCNEHHHRNNELIYYPLLNTVSVITLRASWLGHVIGMETMRNV